MSFGEFLAPASGEAAGWGTGCGDVTGVVTGEVMVERFITLHNALV
jgi:hypothetical protein